MKKAGLFLAAMLIGLAACGTPEKKDGSHSGGGSPAVVEEQGVEMKIAEDGGKPKLVITNNTEKMVTAGMHYKLEKKKDGGWEHVNSDMMFMEKAFVIKPGKSFDQEIELKKDEGEYQVSKEVFLGEGEKVKLVLSLK
ncbi:immunoglobulin-like domain-containing protein [Fictibacillus iocasae]|uniref:Immunoglobulin-like domain-containing protein n=1 Tax=Fictibacillus iocasae TaxID=2715437 RepID=A0ABW2NQT6_9BACL